jgi:hypothetical protein
VSTSTDGWLRPRSAGDRQQRQGRHRRRRHYRLGQAFSAPAGKPALATGADAPSLGMREPELSRSAVVSGSLSLGAHLLIVAFLALAAWLAPDMVDEIIPVQIIREAPEPPPPAPRRVVVPRRAVARTRVPTTVPRPTPVARPAVQPVAARAVQQANIRPTAAPTQIAQRQVTAQRVTAQRTLASSHASAIKVAQVPVAAVGATDLTAPAVDLSGPRAIAPAAAVDVTAPQAFGEYDETANVEYSDAATVTASAVDVPAAGSGFTLDAELVEGARTFGTPGGAGEGVTGTPCTKRGAVQQYYRELQDRTLGAWRNFELPDDIAANSKVVLKFAIDESGTASSVSVVDAPSKRLGESCKQALIAASPFPSMSQEVRCLAGRKLNATFTIPVKGAPGS